MNRPSVYLPYPRAWQWVLRASLRVLSAACHLGMKLPQTDGYSSSLGENQEPLEVCDNLHATCEVWESCCGGQRKTKGWSRGTGGCLQTGERKPKGTTGSRRHLVPGGVRGRVKAVPTRSVCGGCNLIGVILLVTHLFVLSVEKSLSLPSNDYTAIMFRNVGKGTGDQTRPHHKSVTQRVVLGFNL